MSLYPSLTLGGTRIVCDLAKPGRARLVIHDIAGRLVRVVGEAAYPAGHRKVSWDGTNSRCDRVAAGMYLVQIEADGKEALTKAIVLL
jgi:flagellar hook assembly protein FlgD